LEEERLTTRLYDICDRKHTRLLSQLTRCNGSLPRHGSLQPLSPYHATKQVQQMQNPLHPAALRIGGDPIGYSIASPKSQLLHGGTRSTGWTNFADSPPTRSSGRGAGGQIGRVLRTRARFPAPYLQRQRARFRAPYNVRYASHVARAHKARWQTGSATRR